MVNQRWTKKSAFAHFGAKATNSRWGWSARNEDGTTVVLTVWDDEFDPDEPNAKIDMFGHRNLRRWQHALGNKDRIKHLKLARDNCGALFHIVVATARDVNASPRSTRRVRPHPRVMRLTELNEETGEFRAVSAED